MWSSHATGPNIKEGGREGVREVVCYLKDTFSVSKIQGVHKIFCFFEDFKIYIPDSGLSFSSVCTSDIGHAWTTK